MFNLTDNTLVNIRRELKKDNPQLGQSERVLVIGLLIDDYILNQEIDDPDKVEGYFEDLQTKPDEDLLFLINEKGLI